jgi:hypothetical protein
MTIIPRTFELVAEHLADLSYDRPVSLSCDDTKLHPAWCVFWDAENEAHYLIGGANEPYLVTDPAALCEIIEGAKLTLATKMRLWCLQVPLPKLAPIIITALPIASNNDAKTLAAWTLKIIAGLRQHNICVISYACDGTEVERAVQRMLVSEAECVILYEIASPAPGLSTIKIEIPVLYGQAIVNIQDPKHGLKTFHNNLFSGAQLLTLGNYTAQYSRIRAMAFKDGTPLYHRDVEKLDHQDDNAAARLFSSATLKFLIDHHPDDIGEIVFLFVHGEIVDAYQNQAIPHQEHIKMVFRACYFYDGWRTYLERVGYKETQYFMSCESTDITARLIDGLVGLIVVYRDHISGDHPLLP